MITAWEVYKIEYDMGEDTERHIAYYACKNIKLAFERWKNEGGFNSGFGLRLALAKPEWIKG